MKMDKLKFYEATVGNGIRIDSAKTICSALNLNFDEWFDVKVIVVRMQKNDTQT